MDVETPEECDSSPTPVVPDDGEVPTLTRRLAMTTRHRDRRIRKSLWTATMTVTAHTKSVMTDVQRGHLASSVQGLALVATEQ